MREQPTSFAKFVNNQDLNVEEISIEEFVKMGKENIIFRDDFAFLSLFLDIQKLNNALNLNTPLKNIFPDSGRPEKWTEFRKQHLTGKACFDKGKTCLKRVFL